MPAIAPNNPPSTGRQKQVTSQLDNLDALLDQHWAQLSELFSQLEPIREARPVEADNAPDPPVGGKVFHHIEQQMRKVASMTNHIQQVITELEV
jgi:hypothetical protein